MERRRKYNPAKFNPIRGGHAQGHLRNAFVSLTDMIDQGGIESLRLDAPITDEGEQVGFTVSEIIGLLWNCTDCLPSAVADSLATAGVEFRCRSYGAGARALKRSIGG